MSAQLQYRPAAGDTLCLVAIDRANLMPVMQVKTAESQRRFVSDNAVSIAQSHYHPSAWCRAVYRDATPVGLVMLYDPRGAAPDDKPFFDDSAVLHDGFYLWRLMVGEAFQGQGLGRQIVDLLKRVSRDNGFARLYVSYVDAEDGPAPFYRGCGFVPTGRRPDDEIEAVVPL